MSQGAEDEGIDQHAGWPGGHALVAIAANLGAAAFSEQDALQLLALFNAGTKAD